MDKRGPGLFSDFGKKARDLLNKDYVSNRKIKVSSSSNIGVIEMALNVANIGQITKVIASVKLPDYNTGKVEVRYLHQLAGFSVGVGLKKYPAIDFSVTVGTASIAFGADASYNTASREFVEYNTGFSFTNLASSASLILADKGDSIRATYVHYLNQLKGGAFVGEMNHKFSSNENTLTVACSYVLRPQTVLKAKLNSHGSLGAHLRHELKPKSFLTFSAAFDAKALQNAPKLGLAFSQVLTGDIC